VRRGERHRGGDREIDKGVVRRRREKETEMESEGDRKDMRA
jgi:hypothetical protein